MCERDVFVRGIENIANLLFENMTATVSPSSFSSHHPTNHHPFVSASLLPHHLTHPLSSLMMMMMMKSMMTRTLMLAIGLD